MGRWLALAWLLLTVGACAEDWPEMQGAGRRSVWNETGILRQFPAEGLAVSWRVPIGGGFSGPAVAGGRVFVSDYVKADEGGRERVLCLDEATGRVLWTHENPAADYSGFAYNSGPRATPTVSGDQVYVVGAAGDLYCLEAATGALVWQVSYLRDFGAKLPTWGFSGAPLVVDEVVVCAVGGAGNARLVGLDAATGKEVWRALPSPGDVAYSSPVLAHAAGVDQVIHWIAGEVAAVDPRSGVVLWQQPFASDIPVVTPTVVGDRVLVSDFYKGALLLRLKSEAPRAEVVWQVGGKNELNTDGLHALMSNPVMVGDCIFGVCSYGQFRCLDLATGQRLWETLEVTREQARWASAFIVQNGDVLFINNDRGELIIAQPTAAGYRELGRTPLIKPTTGGAGTRELGLVNWVYPAFANRHLVTRNDEEIIRVSLAE